MLMFEFMNYLVSKYNYLLVIYPGTRTLGDILSDRVKIAQEMHDLLAEGTLYWGVSVERVEVKDVRVPEQLMRAMAAEAEAAREARAKVTLDNNTDDNDDDTSLLFT